MSSKAESGCTLTNLFFSLLVDELIEKVLIHIPSLKNIIVKHMNMFNGFYIQYILKSM